MLKQIILLITLSWLASFISASVIECQWNGEKCLTVTNMSPVYTAYETITVSGKPTNYVNTATDTISLKLFTINFIPVKIFNVFTNIQNFVMQNCSTTVLTTDSFVNCAPLRSIQISFGVVTNIPEGFAQTCTNIDLVRFSYSNVETVHKNAFKNLGQLAILDLTGNKITCIHAELFQPTPLLYYIHLQNNKITGIDGGLIKNLIKLRMINLVNNSIKYLPALTLPTGADPIAILLFGNPITAVSPNLCSSFNTRSHEDFMDTFSTTDYKDANGKPLFWWADVIFFKDLLCQNGIPCLVPGITFNKLGKDDCANYVNVMKTCYANYSPTMTDIYVCESGCSSSVILNKVADFIKFVLKTI